MKINKLTLKNFKGIKSLTIDASSQNVNIYGDNATGKTTIFDAFLWLLFGKDSRNSTDFNIKTLDENGQVISGLEHEVEGVFEVDGKRLMLKKVYSENWVKTRGSANKILQGNTTEHFVNDVPCKKGEFDDKIKSIVDEKVFKLLTNPTYFNEQMHWQDRKNLLFEVCGNISDQDIISSSPSLSKLNEILGDRTIEQHQKIIAAKKKEINEQLQKIPIRIDTWEQSKPNIANMNFSQIEQDIKDLTETQEQNNQAIVRLQSGGEIAEKEKQIAIIESELLKLKNENESKKNEALKEINTYSQEVEESLRKHSYELNSTEDKIKIFDGNISVIDEAIKQLREYWTKVNDKPFECNQAQVCPTCGQAIHSEKLEEVREEALKQFNLAKANELEETNQKGKGKAVELAQLKSEKQQAEEESAKLRLIVDESKGKLGNIISQISDIKAKFSEAENTPEYISKLEEKNKILSQIDALKAGNSDELNQLRNKSAELNQMINELRVKFGYKNQVEVANKNIEQLKAEERKLAEEFENLESELYLTEQFIRTKVDMLTERINSKFEKAKFKLFDQQINGGLQECCETTFNGVPYADLNNAARINIGLDIINTLSNHFGFVAPIFIDNKESVTKLTETKAQIISLIVSKDYNALRVEE